MASSYSSVDHSRNLLREQARQQRRAQEVERQKKENAPAPLFGAPIKIKRNDPVHRHITDVLGEYDDVQSMVKHPSAIGIIQQPATPAPCHNHDPPSFPVRNATDTQSSTVKSSHQRLNGTHPNRPRPEQDKHVHARSGRAASSSDRERKSSRSTSRSPNSVDHPKERRRSRGPSDHDTKAHQDRHGVHRSSQNISRQLGPNDSQIHSSQANSSTQGSSKVSSSTSNVAHKSSSGSKVHHSAGHSPTTPDPGQDHERERHDSGSSTRSSHSSESAQDSVFHSPHGRPRISKAMSTNPSPVSQKKPLPKPNGIINGAIVRGAKEEKPKIRGLKLEMPVDEGHGKSQISVEKIIEEMSFDEPPLTGLLTPKKEDVCKFPFPASKEPTVKQLFPKGKNNDPSTLTKNNPMGASEGGTMMHSSELLEELDVSSDSDADTEVTASRRKSSADPPPKRAPHRSVTSKMADSSDSSSSSESSCASDSDGSSSDSEDEKKDEEEEVKEELPPSLSPPVPNRSWELRGFMHNNTVAPIPGLPTVAPSVLQEISKVNEAVNMDDDNERLVETFIQSGLDDLEKFMENTPKSSDALDDALAGLGIPKVKVHVGDNGLLPIKNQNSSPLQLDLLACVKTPAVHKEPIGANVNTCVSEKLEKSQSTTKSPCGVSGKSPASISGRVVGRSPSRRARKSVATPPASEEKVHSAENVSKHSKLESVVSPSKSGSRRGAQSGSASKSRTPPRATPPRAERRTGGSTPKGGRKKATTPKSQEFLPSASSDSSDDEYVEKLMSSPRVASPRVASPIKINGDLKSESGSRQQKSSQSKPAKSRERTNHVKRSSISSVPDLNDVFDEVIGPSKLLTSPLSPLHNPDTTVCPSVTLATTATPTTVSISTSVATTCSTAATTPSILSGLTYVDGRPSIMVRLDLSLVERLSPAHCVGTAGGDHLFGMGCMSNASGDGLAQVDCTDGLDGRVPEVDCRGGGEGTQLLESSGRALTPKKVEPVLDTIASMDFGEIEEGEVLNVEPMISPLHNPISAITSIPEKVVSESQASNPSSPVTAAPPGACGGNNDAARKAAMEIIAQINKDTKLPKTAKIPKRKPASDGAKEDYKRQRRDAKTTPKRTADQSDRERTSHKDDHQWDRKNHWRSETERHGSSSSTSSLHADERESKRAKFDRPSGRDSREREVRDGWDRDRDRERDRDRRRDRDSWDVWDRDSRGRSNASSSHRADPFFVRDMDAPNGSDNHLEASPAFNGAAHPAGSQWSALISGHNPTPPPPQPQNERRPERPNRLWLEPEEKLHSADYYLGEAKKLKHQADGLSDRLAKSLMYVEAVLSFIMYGNAMEQENISEPNKIFTMYRDTLNLLRHICKFRGSQENDVHDKEKKLSVLSLRIQALLCRKLYKLKKSEVSKLKRVIDDHNKSASGKPVVAQAPSPYQTNWNARSTGTPSPMSPTPSPAGSVGSVGSVGSGNGEHRLTNGSLGGSSNLSSPSAVSVPQRIHSVTQNYLSLVSYLIQCEEIWDQADAQAQDDREFFHELDCQCGALSLHSSILDLVRYIRLGLHRLKDT